MQKIGQFIYPWGNGHFSRMMRLNDVLSDYIHDDFESHFSSKSPIYEKLLERFPNNHQNIHRVLMPTPIDGRFGPSLPLSMLNLFFPIAKNPSLIQQTTNYLREERKLYDTIHFDLVINDGDMGSNVLAYNRQVPSLFITNQFKPKLWRSRFYFYPSLIFIAKQIAKASKILVADSAPPYTICKYNLNFTKEIMNKVVFVGHFTNKKHIIKKDKTSIQELIKDVEFGYWMRTGNKSTNCGTGEKYEQVFHKEEMKNERRIISHAKNDPSIDCVIGKDNKKYTIHEALEKKIDWIQIDVGFLLEQDKESILEQCRYAVINGSHTVMGEILGGKSKPIIGIPIYDEHTNQLRWAEEENLGILAQSTKKVIEGIRRIKGNYNKFEENLEEFSSNFNGDGAQNTAKIAAETLEK
jgi:hypothetical protein